MAGAGVETAVGATPAVKVRFRSLGSPSPGSMTTGVLPVGGSEEPRKDQPPEDSREDGGEETSFEGAASEDRARTRPYASANARRVPT